LTDYIPEPQITVLDAGGQYCHLVTRKVRDLGVYAEVRDSDTPASQLRHRKGVIISGGPSSVYEPGSPTVDPDIYDSGSGVLGICYGLQLMARHLGGTVQKGEKGEYGLAWLEANDQGKLLRGIPAARQRIWMSHRDLVSAAPPGFAVSGSTETCAVAAMEDRDRKLYGVQFHPEVPPSRVAANRRPYACL
jgi:GMP synthase (glutamine-hydrolysing)